MMILNVARDVPYLIIIIFIKYMKQEEIKELEDIFLTEEFKSLSMMQRLWIRIKVALIQTISL